METKPLFFKKEIKKKKIIYTDGANLLQEAKFKNMVKNNSRTIAMLFKLAIKFDKKDNK